MKKSNWIIIVACVGFFCLQCKKNQPGTDDQSSVPTGPFNVRVMEAHTYESGGVQLVAEITSLPENTEDCGFIVSPNKDLNGPGTLFLPITQPVNRGVVRLDVNGGLKEDSTYYFTFYMVENSVYTVSNIKPFVASGSKQLKIDSIAPLQGHIGDSLYVYGKYFSNRYPFHFAFGKAFAPHQVINDSVMRVVVPENIEEVTSIITLEEDTTTKVIATNFSLYRPIVTDFTSNARIDDTLSIKGDHFDTDSKRNIVMFDDIPAKIVRHSRKELDVIVPQEIRTMQSKISVTAQLQTTVSEKSFQISPPIIEQLPKSGNTNEEIVLRAKNLYPSLDGNTILFEGIPGEVTNKDGDKLTVKIPLGPFPRRKAKVSLKMLDYETSYPTDFVIEDKWVMVAKDINGMRERLPAIFTINGATFAFTRNPNDRLKKCDVLKFNSSNYRWQHIKTLNAFGSGLFAATATQVYHYTASSGSADYFGVYNVQKNTWATLPALPTSAKGWDAAALFTIGKYVYLLRRATGVEDFPLYVYDPDLKSWSERQGLSGDLFGASEIGHPIALSLQGVAYIGGGSQAIKSGNFCSYDPTTNHWSLLPYGGPIESSPGSAFLANGKAYFIDSGHASDHELRMCYQFDPATQTWTRMEDPISRNISFNSFENSRAFVLKDKAYVFIPNEGNSDDSGLYEINLVDLR